MLITKYLDWLGLILIATAYLIFAFTGNMILFLSLNILGTTLVVIYTYIKRLYGLLLLNIVIDVALVIKFVQILF